MTLDLWKLVSVRLEIVLVSVQDRCPVCAKRTIGLDIVFNAPIDRWGVPDLSVRRDNFDLVEVDPHDPTTTSEPEAPMQSLNQLPMVTNLASARSA